MIKSIHIVRRYFSFPARRRKLLRQSLLVCGTLRVLLGRLSLKTILTFLADRQKNSVRATQAKEVDKDEILWSVRAVSRRLPGTTCLLRAIAAKYLLELYGIESRLCIGVRKEDGTSLSAHAWITIESEIVLGRVEDLDKYTPLPGLDLL